MRIGRVDVTFDYVVVHEPIDDPGTFPFGGADHQRVEEQMPFVNEAVNAGRFGFSRILVGVVRVERIASNFELLAR